MAKLTFSEDNVRTIERLSKKYDPETHPALKDHTDTMPADDWVFMCDYMRRRTRETIITCLCARAYLDSLIERGMLGSKGLEEFFHGSVHAAQSNLGVSRDRRSSRSKIVTSISSWLARARSFTAPLRSASYPLRRSLSKGNGGS